MSTVNKITDTSSVKEDVGRTYTPNYWTSKLNDANKSQGNTEQKIYSPHVMLHSPRIPEYRGKMRPPLFNDRPGRIAGFSWEPTRLNILSIEPQLDHSSRTEYEYHPRIIKNHDNTLDTNERKLFYQRIFIENSKRLQGDRTFFENELRNLDETKLDQQFKGLQSEEIPQNYYDFEINDERSLNQTKRNLNFFSSHIESQPQLSKHTQFENQQERSVALNLNEKCLSFSMFNITYSFLFRNSVESEKRSKGRSKIVFQAVCLLLFSMFLQLGCLFLLWSEIGFFKYLAGKESFTIYLARLFSLLVIRIFFMEEIKQALLLVSHCIWYRNLMSNFTLGISLCALKICSVTAFILTGVFSVMKLDKISYIFLMTMILLMMQYCSNLLCRHFIQSKKPKIRLEFGVYNPEEELLMVGVPGGEAGNRKLKKMICTILVDVFICLLFIFDIFDIYLYI